jgi:NADH:ubiquinone oxidoreductase subunit C
MTIEEIKIKVSELLPSAAFEVGAGQGNGWLNINIESKDWLSLAKQLRNDDSLFFNYLFCLTCIDWKTHLTMVYFLSSTKYRHTIVVKSKLDRNNPGIESVSDIWKTAEFNEREVFEMFGVNFLNHPDLRLLILPDGWEAKKPMLKDFEDAVNMIRL